MTFDGYTALGVAVALLAVGSVLVARPRQGVSPPFMQHDLVNFLYPIVPMVLGAVAAWAFLH